MGILMISIAVLEDEDEFAKTLMGHIHQYSIEMNIPIEVERFYDGMSFLDEYSEKIPDCLYGYLPCRI